MKMMIRYELKKVFASAGGKLAAVLTLLLVLVSSYMAVSGVEWVNEAGDPETGFAAISKLRHAQKEWAGPLDEARLESIIRENQRLCATPEAQSKDYKQNDIAYGWKQGIRPVLDMMNYAYSAGFQEFDWYCNERVTPDQAGDFYTNRTNLMKQWLYEENSTVSHLFTEKERSYLVDQYESLQTPFYYDYTEGWTQLLYNSPFVIMTVALVLGYLAAGIFANEFRWKADSIFFSTVLGRNRAVWAKVKAGFLLVTVLYWAAVTLYSLITLICLGFDGWNCPLQTDLWKSFYHLKLWQAWLLVAVGGYIGNLFFAFLTMWVSAKTRSSMFAATVPFLLIFLPTFLDNLGSDRISKLLGLLPDQLLQIYQALRYFNVYEIFGKVFSAMSLLLPTFTVLTLLLAPMMYREFRRKQIR
ncbi:MAG: ABC transporter permease [Faecousia sp.]